MTGFAREAGVFAENGASLAWAWEMKSVNGRALDVRVRVPPGYDVIGEEARKALNGLVTRGTVNVTLTIQRAENRKGAARINVEALGALVASLRALPSDLGLPPPTLDALLQVRGIVESDERDEAGLSDALAADLASAARKAASALASARKDEGRTLAGVLKGQLDAMERLVQAVENHPARSVEAIRERLSQQVAALMETGRALEPARLHQEAALIATRADVREELDRLASHIAASRQLLADGGAIGRKLDFLAQEFGREASTLCAKANHVELSRLGLELRTLVDQFREQVQNVE
jgi:uncharacterized protein (TIGR00255 family)